MILLDRIGIDFGRRVPTEDGVAFAVKNGLKFIDSLIDVEPNAFLQDRSRAPAIRRTCEEHGIHLGIHTLSAVNIAEMSTYMRDAADQYLRAFVDLCLEIGGEWVIVHGGYHFTSDYRLRRQASLERLQRAADYAEKRGVLLLLENMNREPKDAEVQYLGASLEECQFYFDNLKSANIQWSFTVNHAHLWPEVGIDGFLDGLDFSRCREVRLADCRGTVEEHLSPGKGTIDFGAMFRRIEGLGYTGHYTNAWGTVQDMFDSRGYLVARAREAGVKVD